MKNLRAATRQVDINSHLRPYFTHPVGEYVKANLTKKVTDPEILKVMSGNGRITDEIAAKLVKVTAVTEKEWLNLQWRRDRYELLEPAVNHLHLEHGSSSVGIFFHWFRHFCHDNNLEQIKWSVQRAQELAALSFCDNGAYVKATECYR